MDAATAGSLLRTAEETRPKIRGFDGAGVIKDLERQYPAMIPALDWFLDTGQPANAFRLASALVPFWLATKRIDDGAEWFEAALARAGDPRPARAIYDYGYLVYWAGRYELAERRFVEARALAEAAGDADLVALALAGSARVALNDDVDAAVLLLREAIDATEGTSPGDGRSSAMHVLGVALQMSGDLAGARAIMAQRIELGRATDDEFQIWVESANLSMVERQLGNLAEAEALSRDALRIVTDRGDHLAIPWVVNGLAAVTAAQGDHERAATMLGMAEAMLGQAGGEWPPDEREQYDSTLALVAASLTPAALAIARDAGSRMSVEQGVRYALADGGTLDPTSVR